MCPSRACCPWWVRVHGTPVHLQHAFAACRHTKDPMHAIMQFLAALCLFPRHMAVTAAVNQHLPRPPP